MSMKPTITFWHSGIEKVVTGEPTGKVQNRKIWICQAWHVQGILMEIRWTDGKGLAYTSWVSDEHVLDHTPLAQEHDHG